MIDRVAECNDRKLRQDERDRKQDIREREQNIRERRLDAFAASLAKRENELEHKVRMSDGIRKMKALRSRMDAFEQQEMRQ